MKQLFTLVAITALCALLSSCRPGSISGQVVLTQAGVNYPLGAVQVEVISARDADDFMTQCQAGIDGKVRALNAAYDNARTARDDTARVESRTPAAGTKAELARAQKKLDAATIALRNYPTANDYFAGFLPAPLESTTTDAEGQFTIDRPKQAAKVFAKAQSQTSGSVEDCFWLVDLPATGDQLILNDNNMFKVPRQSLR